MQNKQVEKSSAYPVRMPVDVRQWLASRATFNDRSMNAELVRILKAAMEKEAAEQKQTAA